jgi:tRNA nucleotidyltransferase (CCA-adding enzyme)
MCADQAKLIDKLPAALPPMGARLLHDTIGLTNEAGLSAYLVGGPVRDLLLGRPINNLDVAIEGDATALARRLKSGPGFRVVVHPAFGTAVIRSGGFILDLTTTRRETYERPGALPAVTPGSLDDDLHRRDFTINAMALALDGPRRGELIDPLRGRADLDSRLIRVLHELSFHDDATRIIRAARYEARLDFRIQPQTEAWAGRDAGFLGAISGARIHHELARTFDEPEPERALLRLSQLGALTAIQSSLTFTPAQARAFTAVRALDRRAARAAYWPILAWPIEPADAPDITARLALRRPQAEAVAAVPAAREIETAITGETQNSRLVETLAPFPIATLWALAAMTRSEAVSKRIVNYLRRLRRLKPLLNGDDVIALGASEGPLVGEILRRLKTARLDGETRTRADEESIARNLLAGAP